MSHLYLAPPAPEIGDGRQVSSTIRVTLGIDHEMMRRSLLGLLEEEDGVEVIAQVDDLQTTLRSLQRDRPDVLVFDHRAPDSGRYDAIGEFRARAPQTQVVLLTMEDSLPFARLALDSGALGFVLKDRADSDLLPAIRAAARGEPYISPQVTRSRGRSSARG